MVKRSDRLDEMETFFKALGDATRLRILGLLQGGEVCVCHIHETLKIPQPKASRHLAYLRDAGLVETRRDGLWVHYRRAEVPDVVLRTIEIAVQHGLTHLDVVRRDCERLEKKTGCCIPTQAPALGGALCCKTAISKDYG